MKRSSAVVLLIAVPFVAWMSSGSESGGVPSLHASQVAIGKLDTRTNREGPVTVTVTPKEISPQAETWDFEVTLETHSASLDQDLTRVAVLIDASGTARPPLGWEGDPPGGHHRKGVLRFSRSAEETEFVELRLSGVGGVPRRAFRWRLR